jgi:hypothetical protein
MTKIAKKHSHKTILNLPHVEHSKSAVLNSLSSLRSRRSYEHAIRDFIDLYCSEPRLAFNRTVVTRYRIALEQRRYAPSTINLRLRNAVNDRIGLEPCRPDRFCVTGCSTSPCHVRLAKSRLLRTIVFKFSG